MLHDPKRDIPQLLTIERVAMWLETQPPEKEYDYFDNGNCLLAQYLADFGYKNIHVTDHSAYIDGTPYTFPNTQFNRMLYPGRSKGTYGDTLDRAKVFMEINKLKTV